jgi:hypothetical protein
MLLALEGQNHEYYRQQNWPTGGPKLCARGIRVDAGRCGCATRSMQGSPLPGTHVETNGLASISIGLAF